MLNKVQIKLLVEVAVNPDWEKLTEQEKLAYINKWLQNLNIVNIKQIIK